MTIIMYVLDVVMVLTAVLLSTLAGTAIPLESFLSGQLFNMFIFYSAAVQLSNNYCEHHKLHLYTE